MAESHIVVSSQGEYSTRVPPTAVKSVVNEIPLGQLVSIRGFAGFAVAVVIAPLAGGFDKLRPRNPRAVGIMTALLLLPFFLLPFSLRFISLADALLLAYLSPVVVAALSPWLLAEKVGWRRWSAVVLGLVGAALVLNPEGGTLHPAVLAPITVAILIGLRDMMTRIYIKAESALALIAMANLAAGVAGLATLPFGWIALDPRQWGLLIMAAMLLTVSQCLIVTSFRYADAAVMSCLKYTSVIWAALLGWLFWGDKLSLVDWLGAALIAISGVIITLRSKKTVP